MNTGSKNIKISDHIFYVTYDNVTEFRIMNLFEKHDYLMKPYAIKNVDNEVYTSGHLCGRRLVFETESGKLQLFDVSDVLLPQFLGYLPQDEGLVPRPQG